MIEFKNVSFTYPEEYNQAVDENGNRQDAESTGDLSERPQEVFKDLNLSLPKGVVSLIGPNGTGKSTFLLLAGGCMQPTQGVVTLNGVETIELSDEELRQKYVSFIFQNMEFETEETIEELLHLVYENGFWEEKDEKLITELIEVFELKNMLSSRTQDISKGELQRTILAFSLLYGSEYLLMDEPIFALEDYQKKRALAYITRFTREHNLGLLYSVHELELSEKYSDKLLLFSKDTPPLLGPTADIFKPELIEKAYTVPFAMLKTKETIYRESLKGYT